MIGDRTLRVRGAGCVGSKKGPRTSENAPTASDNDIDLRDIDSDIQDLDSVEETHEEVLHELRLLDEKLVTTLLRGDIRLLRVSWLVAWASAPANGGRILPNRQELEALEAAADEGGEGSPLLRPKEAAALFHCADRRVGILSHGWLTAGHCDPEGARLAVVVRALKQFPQLQALFWDYASMYQKPRTDSQDAAFRSAIAVMGDLCTHKRGSNALLCPSSSLLLRGVFLL